MQADFVSKVSAVAFAITESLVIVFSLLAILLVVGRDWRRILAVRRPSFTHTFLTLLMLPALMLAGGAAYEMTKLVVPGVVHCGIPDIEDVAKCFKGWHWSIAVLIIGLGPGIGEELWFRGFLGRGLVGRHGYVLGVMLTSFLFGLIHMLPRQAVAVIVIAIPLHFVYITTRSLLLPMLLHFLNNAASALAIASDAPHIPGLQELEKATHDHPVIIYLGAAVLMASVGWAFYQSRVRLQHTGEVKWPWRPDFPGVECPPPGCGSVIVHPPLSLTSIFFLMVAILIFLAASFFALISNMTLLA